MNPLIEARNLTKKFNNKVALNTVNFTINQGDSIALVGPNGAGKSTLMSLICGFLRPTSGEVIINGRPRSTSEAMNIIGALPQDALFHPAQSIGEQLVFLARLHGLSGSDAIDEAKRVLQNVRLETSYNARPTTLSHGMAKRVSIAQAILVSRQSLFLMNQRRDWTQRLLAILAIAAKLETINNTHRKQP